MTVVMEQHQLSYKTPEDNPSGWAPVYQGLIASGDWCGPSRQDQDQEGANESGINAVPQLSKFSMQDMLHSCIRECPTAQVVDKVSSDISETRAEDEEELISVHQPQIRKLTEHTTVLPLSLPATVGGIRSGMVRLESTAGVIDIIVRPDWAPQGARRFLDLVVAGELDQLAFYRAIAGRIAQFGLPTKQRWDPIPDDPHIPLPFCKGVVSFATAAPHCRTSALFICIGDMSRYLGQNAWEVPFATVAESSFSALDRIDCSYGDIAEFGGSGPAVSRIITEGSSYLAASFPKLSYIVKASLPDWQPGNPQDVSSIQCRPADLVRPPIQVLPQPFASPRPTFKNAVPQGSPGPLLWTSPRNDLPPWVSWDALPSHPVSPRFSQRTYAPVRIVPPAMASPRPAEDAFSDPLSMSFVERWNSFLQERDKAPADEFLDWLQGEPEPL